MDDFSRHYLARETSPSDLHWQTALMWKKLLEMATTGGEMAGTTTTTTNAADDHSRNRFSPRSPGKNVTFTGVNGGDAGASPRVCDSAFEGFSSVDDWYQYNGNNAPLTASSSLAMATFTRLWAECVGDNTCAAFADDNCSVLDSMDEKGYAADSTTSSQQKEEGQQKQRHHQEPHAFSSFSKHQDAGPWERLVAALREDRGIIVSQVLSGHECTLLEREVADWLHKAQGRDAQRLSQGKGMAERLASAAAAVLHQDVITSAVTPGKPRGVAVLHDGARTSGTVRGDGRGAMGQPMTGSSEDKRGCGVSTASPRRLSVGGLDFPAVVVEEEPAVPPTHGPTGYEENRNDAAKRAPSPTTGSVNETTRGQPAGSATDTPRKKLERELDLRGVALDAHEVCVARSFYP